MGEHASERPPFISNQVYDVLKWVTQILLPAVATLYFAFSQIWGLPYGSEVVGSITAGDAFLGVILGLTTKRYNNSDAKYAGNIDISNDGEKKLYSLNLNSDIEDIDRQKEVTFKVSPN